jgi:Fic family protein
MEISPDRLFLNEFSKRIVNRLINSNQKEKALFLSLLFSKELENVYHSPEGFVIQRLIGTKESLTLAELQASLPWSQTTIRNAVEKLVEYEILIKSKSDRSGQPSIYQLAEH